MAKHDLTGSLERDFTFNIDDKEFSFRKPTVREMRELGKKFAGVSNEKDAEKQAAQSEAAMNSIYQYITSVGHDANIGDVMEDQPVGVQIAFNKMIQEELAAS